MRGQHHGGKGSTPRPTNKRRFDENYEKIFNKTPSKGESQLDEGVHTPETNGRSGESKFREYAEGAGVQGQADQEQAVEQEPVAWGKYKHETVSYGFSVPEDEVEDVFEKINVFGDITQQNSTGQAKLPNGELTSNVYDAFDKGYAQAKIDLAEQAVEQNPVAWIYEKQLADGFSERTVSFGIEPDFDGVITPLYAHPPKRKPLSDSVIERIIFDWDDAEEEMDLVEFARAIEAAHSITGDEHTK